jgi:hypothetical protein
MISKLYRLFLFLYFLLPVLATTSNEQCEIHRKQLQQTPNNTWIVVDWSEGGCYYHNHVKDGVDTDQFPLQ